MTNKLWGSPLSPRCFETHPPLKLDHDFVIYGGSCVFPKIKDADIYVGFDGMMKQHKKVFPWEDGHSFLYPILDRGVPDNLGHFESLITYLITELHQHRKIHLGCLGGHGRTGLVLAVLVSQLLLEDSPIDYVRDNYCKKAVESLEQVNWLHTHFDIAKCSPSKEAFKRSGILVNRLQSYDEFDLFNDIDEDDVLLSEKKK